jgi:membrane protein
MHRRPTFPRVTTFGRQLVERLLEVGIVDRSLVVGAQAFGALIPLLIVIASVGASDGRSFADALIGRFSLDGASAVAVRRAFAAPAEGDGITVAGALLAVFSAVAFTRAVQRTFELTWGLDRRGVKGTGWGLLWLAMVAVYISLFPVLDGVLGGVPAAIVSLAGTFALWLLTPYLLLARRVGWRRLVPQAAITAGGMTAFSLGSLVYAPRAMSTSASEFGAIGVAFTLLTLLWGAGFVLVAGAAIGATVTLPSWSRASSGSVTPRSSSSSTASGS